MPTWPISNLTCDNVSNTFWKICKAKFDALPDLVCGYIISSEIHWHQLWEADQTLFIESNKFSSNLKFLKRECKTQKSPEDAKHNSSEDPRYKMENENTRKSIHIDTFILTYLFEVNIE